MLTHTHPCVCATGRHMCAMGRHTCGILPSAPALATSTYPPPPHALPPLPREPAPLASTARPPLRRRCSVKEALAHTFFHHAQLTAKREEAARPVDVTTIDFENREVRLPQLRQLILEEIMTYAEPARAEERPDAADGKKRKLPEGECRPRTRR